LGGDGLKQARLIGRSGLLVNDVVGTARCGGTQGAAIVLNLGWRPFPDFFC